MVSPIILNAMNTMNKDRTTKEARVIIYFSLRRPTGNTLYVKCDDYYANELYDEALDNNWSISKSSESLYKDRSRYGRTIEVLNDNQCIDIVNRLNAH